VTRMWDGHKSTGPLAQRRARLINVAGGLDCGIHDIDLVRYLAGRDAGGWRTIHAMGSWMGEAFTLPPHISVMGRLDSGVLASVNASLAWAAHIAPRPFVDTLHIGGRRGVISACVDLADAADRAWQPAKVRLLAHDGIEETPVEHPSHIVSIALLVDAVAATVAGEPDTHLATGEDGYQAQLAVERANRSAVEEAARVECV
jgi:predicted dehydrogenase